jgi:hypothetical protein
MARTPYGWEEGDDEFSGLFRESIMAAETNHTQCLLIGDDGSQRVAWIPSIRANANKVRIDGKIFTVKERYTSMPTKEALENSSDYRRHRKATDV